jgi:hypothetical protein
MLEQNNAYSVLTAHPKVEKISTCTKDPIVGLTRAPLALIPVLISTQFKYLEFVAVKLIPQKKSEDKVIEVKL